MSWLENATWVEREAALGISGRNAVAVNPAQVEPASHLWTSLLQLLLLGRLKKLMSALIFGSATVRATAPAWIEL